MHQKLKSNWYKNKGKKEVDGSRATWMERTSSGTTVTDTKKGWFV